MNDSFTHAIPTHILQQEFLNNNMFVSPTNCLSKKETSTATNLPMFVTKPAGEVNAACFPFWATFFRCNVKNAAVMTRRLEHVWGAQKLMYHIHLSSGIAIGRWDSQGHGRYFEGLLLCCPVVENCGIRFWSNERKYLLKTGPRQPFRKWSSKSNQNFQRDATSR